MNALETPSDAGVPRALRSVELTRAQSLGLALLACVPIPLFTLGATVLPLPGMVERATARFISFAAPTLGEESRVAVRRIDLEVAGEIPDREDLVAPAAQSATKPAERSVNDPPAPGVTALAPRTESPSANEHASGGEPTPEPAPAPSPSPSPAPSDPTTGGGDSSAPGGGGAPAPAPEPEPAPADDSPTEPAATESTTDTKPTDGKGKEDKPPPEPPDTSSPPGQEDKDNPRPSAPPGQDGEKSKPGGKP